MNEVQVTITAGSLVTNLPEIKKWAEEVASRYKGLVFGEDEIKQAKKTRAEVNAIRTDIDAKQKEVKKVYNVPYLAFEQEVKEVLACLDQPIKEIDDQIKEAEERKRQAKEAEIEAIYDEIGQSLSDAQKEIASKCYWLKSDKYLLSAWSLPQIRKDIEANVSNMLAGIETIQQLGGEFSDRILGEFQMHGNLGQALAKLSLFKEQAENARKLKAEREAATHIQETPHEPLVDQAPAIEDLVDISSEPMVDQARILIRGSVQEIDDAISYLDAIGLEPVVISRGIK